LATYWLQVSYADQARIASGHGPDISTVVDSIGDEFRQAHVVSYRPMKMGSPPQEMNLEDEPNAVSSSDFDDRFHSKLRSIASQDG